MDDRALSPHQRAALDQVTAGISDTFARARAALRKSAESIDAALLALDSPDAHNRSELLYGTTDPYEQPLVMPAWARDVPLLAKQIDDGYTLRRAVGLPVDGSFPDDWPGFAQQTPPPIGPLSKPAF